MRSLKTISWITLAVVALMAGVSAFMPKKYSAKAEATMDCPARVTRNIVNNLGLAKKWLWLPGIDTAYSTSCVGVLKGTGASCDYNSSLPASGIIRILNSTPDSISLADERNEGNTTFYKYRITAADPAHTRVTAEATGHSGFLSNLFNFWHSRKLKNQLEEGLSSLARTGRERYTQGIYNGFKITKTKLDQKYFISYRSEVEFEHMAKYYSQNISALYQRAMEAKITAAGMPCGLYYKWDDKAGKADMAAALPTLAAFSAGDASSVTLRPGDALILTYMGDNAKSASAHFAMDEYMEDHGLRQIPPVIEEYMTDPAKEPDPARWVTNIMYYVEPIQ